MPNIGEDLFFGTDINGKNNFGGVIDDLKIITEMSSDTRPYERLTKGTRSVTRDYLSPNPSCRDEQTLLIADFDNPIKLQSRRLRNKVFLNTLENFKYKLSLDDRENLLESINNQEEFESKMIRMGFDIAEARATYIECHHAEGGPIFNAAISIRSDKMLFSAKSVNDSFGLSGRFDKRPLTINNNLAHFRKDGGTIEFWVSPLLDTKNDYSDRYYLDIFSVEKRRVKSINPTLITLPSSASKILEVKLLDGSRSVSSFYSQSEADEIMFDEIYRSEITGVLTGGTGVGKDFSVGASLAPDGRTITLAEALPGIHTDVMISYIPSNLSGERISIYKNKNSQIIFSIKQKDGEISAGIDVDWRRNTWHRVKCIYKANTNDDMIEIFVDGTARTSISYGADGLKYGKTGVYSEVPDSNNQITKGKKITLKDEFRVISIGGSAIGMSPSLARLDNIRFSWAVRDGASSPSGESIDLDYSPNIETVLPVVSDESTTLLLDFDSTDADTKYAVVNDPSRGIFNFDIEVLDGFGDIDSEEIEDLIIQLVNTLKPSHTNALVKFPRESCD